MIALVATKKCWIPRNKVGEATTALVWIESSQQRRIYCGKEFTLNKLSERTGVHEGTIVWRRTGKIQENDVMDNKYAGKYIDIIVEYTRYVGGVIFSGIPETEVVWFRAVIVLSNDNKLRINHRKSDDGWVLRPECVMWVCGL